MKLKMPKFSSFKLKSLSRYKAKAGVVALWEDEHEFLKAVEKIYSDGKIKPITITPYPVHGLEEASKTPRSWIPWVTLVCGLSGCLFGLWFTWWASAVSWPINIGGKPMFSLPAFIPIIFELTILFSAFGSIGALIYACGLPHIEPPVIDKDLSCHKFALFIADSECPKDKAKALFKEVSAPEIKEAEF